VVVDWILLTSQEDMSTQDIWSLKLSRNLLWRMPVGHRKNVTSKLTRQGGLNTKFVTSGDNFSEPQFPHYKNGPHTWTKGIETLVFCWAVLNLRGDNHDGDDNDDFSRNRSPDFWAELVKGSWLQAEWSWGWSWAERPRTLLPQGPNPSHIQKFLLTVSHAESKWFLCCDGVTNWKAQITF
jgi:hypothetical protein